jgi:3-oxoacyl-[acyl-carrier-protein] synthase III
MPISLVAVVVLGLLVVGCGGGSSSGSTASAGGSDKAEFIKQANAICETANEKLTEIVEKSPKIVTATLAAFEIEIDEIGALPPPEGDERKIETMLEHLQKSKDAIETKEDIVTANVELAKAEELAEKYGLAKKVCLIAE